MSKEVSVGLSGSGFRFASHVGALQAILDLGYIITDIAGASGGAIVSSFYAYGISPAQMLSLTLSAPLASFTKVNPWSLVTKQSWNNGNNLYNWLNDHLESATFSNVKLPLTIVATDLNTYNSYIFSQKITPSFNVALADRASSAIPLVFAPVIFGGKFLVDGGLANDLPVNYLTQPVKIAIQLTELDNSLTSNYTAFDVIGKLIDTVLYTNIDNTVHDTPGVVLVKAATPPGMSLKSSLSKDDIMSLYNIGYSATHEVLAKMT